MRTLVAIVLMSAGAFACTGGGGSSGGAIDTWDPADTSNQRSENSREPGRAFAERAPRSGEGAPKSAEGALGNERGQTGSGGAGSSRLPDLDCTGTYDCVRAGDDDVERYRAQIVGGLCIANGMIVDRDGNLYSIVDGTTKVGTWSGQSAITIITGDVTRLCTK